MRSSVGCGFMFLVFLRVGLVRRHGNQYVWMDCFPRGMSMRACKQGAASSLFGIGMLDAFFRSIYIRMLQL